MRPQSITPGLFEKINSGQVTHEDFVDMLAIGCEMMGKTATPELRAGLLAVVQETLPTHDKLVAYLRSMLRDFVQECEPGTRQ